MFQCLRVMVVLTQHPSTLNDSQTGFASKCNCNVRFNCVANFNSWGQHVQDLQQVDHEKWMKSMDNKQQIYFWYDRLDSSLHSYTFLVIFVKGEVVWDHTGRVKMMDNCEPAKTLSSKVMLKSTEKQRIGHVSGEPPSDTPAGPPITSSLRPLVPHSDHPSIISAPLFPPATPDGTWSVIRPGISADHSGHVVIVSGCSMATLQPRILELPAVTPLHPVLEAAILAPPSALDKLGALYVFDIPVDQPNRRMRCALAQAQIKRDCSPLGADTDGKNRVLEASLEAPGPVVMEVSGQRQDWWAYCNIPYAAKFEALIHLHFKLLGAWVLPSECHFCGVCHTEKFGFHACGGRAEIACVVVFYLRHLGWPVDEYLFSYTTNLEDYNILT
ncbi:hypothetical protein B0H17DRAFT_1130575 [Mycena rosella]|uniref:Uncharacterized protein n=1 Tax=Mycena rosella TaxID=1033263 RepID=A0AAD7GJ08_MYCRO|nr:hypothetical protein B0H17DRAFT_1130575 [Mycena rosella]